MSKLYYTEVGHVIPELGEELTRYRRARKVLNLPRTSATAELYILARPYPADSGPLHLSVNGRELPPISRTHPGEYWWYTIPLPAGVLKEGANTFDFWTNATAMNGWSLAMEDGHRDPGSFVSPDSGRSWRNDHMGFLNICRAEYVVRLRLAEGEDPAPPPIVWEDPASERLADLRRMLPPEATGPGSTLDRTRAISTWTATRWEYSTGGQTPLYAPWDAETIIAWGQARRGHNGRLPIAECMHYAIVLVSACQAAGIYARGAAFTSDLNDGSGHFMTEVWMPEHGKWVLVDPNLDAIWFQNGVPVTVPEARALGTDLWPYVQWGPGTEYQMKTPSVVGLRDRGVLTGLCLAQRGVWMRSDFVTHPEFSPPGHGMINYCETSFIWEVGDLKRGYGMFPYFGTAEYFAAPPTV
jgi:hypothetical protein